MRKKIEIKKEIYVDLFIFVGTVFQTLPMQTFFIQCKHRVFLFLFFLLLMLHLWLENEGKHNVNVTSNLWVHPVFAGLTFFFEASKASLLELECDLDDAVKKKIGKKNKFWDCVLLPGVDWEVFKSMDSVCSGWGSVLKSSGSPT